jgi:hypothetical protein
MGTFLIRYATITITIVENHPRQLQRTPHRTIRVMFLKPLIPGFQEKYFSKVFYQSAEKISQAGASQHFFVCIAYESTSIL